MLDEYVEKILRARIYDLVKQTPVSYAKNISKRLNNEIFLKREDLQPVFSFKLRGAHNKILSLTQEEKDRGVIAASAGNHAQGVAMSATKLGLKSTIVMPSTTPQIKVDAVRDFGGETISYGESYDEAYYYALELGKERGLTFIHPFDDPIVIAGQGTIAVEIMRSQEQQPDAIFIPVGGGGLIAGIGAYIKRLFPEIKIIGVEPEDAPTLHRALQEKKPYTLEKVGIFADGVAVKTIGTESFRVAQKVVDEVILVSTDEICAGIKDIFDEVRTVAETAGALAMAGMKKYIARTGCEGQQLVGILSGANINFDRLRHVAERAELGEGKEALLAVEIPEAPGSFLQFCGSLGKRNITEFNYRLNDPRYAHVFVGIEQTDAADRLSLIKSLKTDHFKVLDITDNEAAKVHVRYMVGGHAEKATNEKLFRFIFPERPGALLDFLTQLGTRWNISMFHYRNHGAAYGRVLIGIQLKSEETPLFTELMQKLNFTYYDETNNQACQLFIGAGPQRQHIEN